MQEREKAMSPGEITKLSNELAYQKYLFTEERMRRLYQRLSKSEYIALYFIRETEETSEIYSGRTYLKDLAGKLQLPIRRASQMVKALKERGLLTWSHDGDGSEGTYVTITESGKKLLAEEEEILKSFYGKIIEKFGKENLIQMLQLMKQLETIISAEAENLEGEEADE